MEWVFPDRIPWERQYYSDISNPNCSDSIKCKLCPVMTIKSVIIPHFINHLRNIHYITEITHHPDHEFLLQNFMIDEKRFMANCNICRSSISYEMYGLYLLKNHWEIYHGNSLHIYKEIAKTESGRDMLNKYFIMGSKAVCPKCKLKINMTFSEILTEENLKILLEHYFSHRSISQDIRDKLMKTVDKELKELKEEQERQRDRVKDLELKRLKDKNLKGKGKTYLELKKLEKQLKKENELLRRSISTEISRIGRNVLNEPGPSTSSSMADERTERSEQSGVSQNIPTKRRKSSTLDKTQLKRKKDGNLE